VRGSGRLVSNNSVEVGSTIYTARRALVVATGSGPSIPPIPGLAGTPFWTNRSAIETEEVPESMVVLGGGAIGLELAQVFSRFGSRVSVVEAQGQLLPHEEPEVGSLMKQVFEDEGISVHAGLTAESVGHGIVEVQDRAILVQKMRSVVGCIQ
jgi:pyruvate/2-oxoglutarate dehydrogenase complex dihydrolipoamide dehydrogenase (E3) component